MPEGHSPGTVPSGRRKLVLAALVLCYITICMGVLTLKPRKGERHVPLLTGTRAGQAAPAFQVKTLEGDLFNSASKRRGPVLVNFFAIHCGPCLREFARLEPEIWHQYKDRGLSLIAIGTGHKEPDLAEFRSENRLSFPIAADPDQELAQTFGVPGVPANYVIGIDGRIIYQSLGYSEADFSKLVRAIELELKEDLSATSGPGIAKKPPHAKILQ